MVDRVEKELLEHQLRCAIFFIEEPPVFVFVFKEERSLFGEIGDAVGFVSIVPLFFGLEVVVDFVEVRLALSEAIEQSEAALEQSDALYREGLATLFDVLDAQRQLIGSRQSLIDSEAALAISFVSFHAAIGRMDSAP